MCEEGLLVYHTNIYACPKDSLLSKLVRILNLKDTVTCLSYYLSNVNSFIQREASSH